MFRLPVYVVTGWPAFTRDGDALALAAATVGVIIGTLIGRDLLKRVPETSFKRVLGVALIIIGVLLLFRA